MGLVTQSVKKYFRWTVLSFSLSYDSVTRFIGKATQRGAEAAA
jgi:hypothetical protein